MKVEKREVRWLQYVGSIHNANNNNFFPVYGNLILGLVFCCPLLQTRGLPSKNPPPATVITLFFGGKRRGSAFAGTKGNPWHTSSNRPKSANISRGQWSLVISSRRFYHAWGRKNIWEIGAMRQKGVLGLFISPNTTHAAQKGGGIERGAKHCRAD